MAELYICNDNMYTEKDLLDLPRMELIKIIKEYHQATKMLQIKLARLATTTGRING